MPQSQKGQNQLPFSIFQCLPIPVSLACRGGFHLCFSPLPWFQRDTQRIVLDHGSGTLDDSEELPLSHVTSEIYLSICISTTCTFIFFCFYFGQRTASYNKCRINSHFIKMLFSQCSTRQLDNAQLDTILPSSTSPTPIYNIIFKLSALFLVASKNQNLSPYGSKRFLVLTRSSSVILEPLTCTNTVFVFCFDFQHLSNLILCQRNL